MKTDKIPVVFWHSDPVGADETIVLAGGNFGTDAVVELSPLSIGGQGFCMRSAKRQRMWIKPDFS